MLKRLWKRNKSQAAAVEKLTSSIMPQNAGTTGANAKGATAPGTGNAPAQPKRKPKGMRDSDIIDEDGKSAEEIAAEASKEFDILGLARRVADMPDAAPTEETHSAAPKAPAPESDSGPKFAPKSGPRGPSDPTKSATPPAPAPEATVETAQPSAPLPAATLPQPVLQAVPQAVIASAQPGAPASAQMTTQMTATIADPDFDEDLVDGHIALPEVASEAFDATIDARDVYWDQIGDTDPELLSTPATDTDPNAVAWPGGKKIFRLVRTGNSLIIATDGLSDPFADGTGPTDRNGFGMEVFIEVPGWQDVEASRIVNCWAFLALRKFADVVAKSRGLTTTLSHHGVMSLELPALAAPPRWRDASVGGNPGALIDVPLPPGLNRIADMPLSEVRVVPLTLIYPEELQACVKGGRTERRTLADDLLVTGQGHRTNPRRQCLRAGDPSSDGSDRIAAQ